jgi:hypothetical protein
VSTYWGYVCKSHNPPIESEHWFNRGEDILREAYRLEQAGEWPTVAPTALDLKYGWDLDPEPVSWTTEPIHWLRAHPHCDVALRNEYGVEEPLDGAGATETGAVSDSSAGVAPGATDDVNGPQIGAEGFEGDA